MERGDREGVDRAPQMELQRLHRVRGGEGRPHPGFGLHLPVWAPLQRLT